MKNSILLTISLLFIAVAVAGCTGLNTPQPTTTAIVSPTTVPSASPTAGPTTTSSSPIITAFPVPTADRVDAQMTSQVSIVIGHWVESNYGWDNASLLRDVTYQHKDGDYYVYSFTVGGAPHTARIAFSDGTFTLVDVDNGLVV